ncbi:phage tail spike protein [Enterococcus italicus]|uniref:phage tail spike protein n=1 Tax=Enterococcus italicus TaxID=246144 RepID=UPI003F4668EA
MLDKPMLAVLDNNDRLQCLTDEYFDSCLHTFLQGTAAFFTCSVLQTAEIAQYFKVGNKLSFVSNEVSYHFDITKMSKNEKLVTIQADSLTLELRNEFASEYKASKAMTFKQYLDVFLFAGDNPLVMGINEVSDKSLQAEWTGDSDSVLARLFSLANKFDAEIEFETVLNKHWGLDKVRLNVYRAHSDKYQGIGRKRTDIIMEYGNNVETVEYEENIDDLKTAILPIGTDGLLIGNVVIDEKDKNGNQLFLSIKTDNYIRAVQSRDRFRSKMGSFDGYIAKRWSYETTNENVLAGQALAELKKLCEPKVTVTIKGYEYLGIGDTVLVQNTAYVPTLNLSARISEQEIYFDDPSKNASTFTNVEILKSQVDQSLLDRVNALIEQTKPYTLSLMSDNGVTFKNSEGETTLSAIVYNGTQVITPDVTVRWYKDDVWVKTGYSLEVKASDINDKAVYKAIVIDTNGKERATQDVTVFNVDETMEIVVKSSNGLLFKNGVIQTTLNAIVYRGKNDITALLDANQFKWTKVLSDGTPDEDWNSRHAGGTKSITVTASDIYRRATFNCEIVEI